MVILRNVFEGDFKFFSHSSHIIVVLFLFKKKYMKLVKLTSQANASKNL